MTTPYKILVIDDDSMVLDTAAELLESKGYAVVCAGSGREGVAVARIEQPHLILLDFDMPEMGGTAVIRALKAEPSTAAIPAVALTAATAAAANKLIAAGCVGYIPKPFTNPEFSRVVADIIRVTVARAPLPATSTRTSGRASREPDRKDADVGIAASRARHPERALDGAAGSDRGVRAELETRQAGRGIV